MFIIRANAGLGSLTLRLGTTLYSRFPRLIDQLLRGLCRNSTNMNSLCLSGFQLDLMRLLVNNDSKPAMCLGSCDQSANRCPHDLGAKERRAETRLKWQSMWIAIQPQRDQFLLPWLIIRVTTGSKSWSCCSSRVPARDW